MDSEDLLDQQSDESFQFLDLSPPRLDDQHAEPNVVENNQVENATDIAESNPFPIHESVDDFFDFSPLNLEVENTQVENPSDGFNPFSIDESFDFDFDFSPPPMQGEHAEWTFDENKEFENALAEFDPSSPHFFEELASRVPSKSINEIKTHYENLVYDIELIEAGKIELPDYLDDQQPELEAAHGGDGEVGSSSKEPQGKGIAAEKKKRRGSAWTEEEHKNFLKGLAEYGKGDWRSISRVHVLSKTPTQIASHAQKFYRRQKNPYKKFSASAATSSTYPYPRKRRSSIHDIAKVVTSTTTITIPTSPPKPDTTPQQTEQSLHNPVPSAPLTNMINAQQNNCTSFSPLISSSTTVSIPPLQSIDEEAPFPPLAYHYMTIPPWITSTTTTITATTTFIPPRPKDRPRHNFNPRGQTDQQQAVIPLPLMHRNLTLPSRITSYTTPTTALIPPRSPRHNFNIPRPTTQQAAIFPLMGRLNLTNFRPPIIPSTPRPTVSIPSIKHHFNPPQIDQHQQQHKLPPFPENINVDFPPVPLIRHNFNNIPNPETDHHDPELPPLPYCNVPFPPPLTSNTPAMNPLPFEQTQSFLSFYRSSVPCSTTVSTITSDPGPSAIISNGLPSSSSSYPPTKNWFWPN